jgi:hypothetical protein
LEKEEPVDEESPAHLEEQVSALNLEDRESIINSIPISMFRPNSITVVEGKLSKNTVQHLENPSSF